MKRRSALAVAVSSALAVTACGSGDDATPTSVEITLITTTTSTTEPVFVAADPVDAEPVTSDVVDAAPDDTLAPPEETVVDDPAEADPDDGETNGSETDGETDSDTDGETADPVDDSSFTLAVDGLGATAFGADPEGAISYVSSFFGEPSADTGWVDPFEIGACSGTEIRQVDWGQLRLEFGDVSNVTEGRPHFYAYTYGAEGSLGSVTPPGLATPEGVAVGSSVADLMEAYPATQLFSADEFFPASFIVNTNLNGRLSGLADDDVVEVIIGGIPCLV